MTDSITVGFHNGDQIVFLDADAQRTLSEAGDYDLISIYSQSSILGKVNSSSVRFMHSIESAHDS